MSLVACQFTENEQQTLVPPIQVAFTVPADSAQGIDDPEGFDFVARFRRDVTRDEVTTLQFAPRPVATGPVELVSARELVVYDVVLDTAIPTYDWLLDGRDFLEPVSMRVFTADSVRYRGIVLGAAELAPRVNHEEAVIVFLLARTVPDELVPEGVDRMLGLPVVGIRSLGVLQPGGEATFSFADLPIGAEYVLLAVQDTDGDGRHEPRSDWWGYPRSSVAPDLVLTSRAQDITNPFALRTVRLEIVAPGTLDPGDFPFTPDRTSP